MHPLGFVRVVACSPDLVVGDPIANSAKTIEMALLHPDADIVLFPELGLSAYTCGELFRQDVLLDACEASLALVAEASQGLDQLWVVGLPWRHNDRLFNVAAGIANGEIVGLIPKQCLPTYQEFYEKRWFTSGTGCVGQSASIGTFRDIPFGTDLLFRSGEAIIGIEICEDLWVPTPPSSFQALAGANILLNLSASNETIGKNAYRRNLVVSQSGRCLAGYVYAGAGPSESTMDLVFGGHCLIADNGVLLEEADSLGRSANGSNKPFRNACWVEGEIDLGRIAHDRRMQETFDDVVEGQASTSYRIVDFVLERRVRPLKRTYSGQPFVPKDKATLSDRCDEIFAIQCAALAKRVRQLQPTSPLVIGVSGGLDSTLALLVAVAMCDRESMSRKRILGVTMPGFGTSKRTLVNARSLMNELGISSAECDIREASLIAFRDLKHQPFGFDPAAYDVESFQKAIEKLPDEHNKDLIFENVQARLRTFHLMSRGFVLGTGDLSEQALGWSTYNGDHMSMYNVNTSIPKTLVRFLIQHVAEHHYDGAMREILLSIAETPISPELLPLGRSGEIRQATESTIGPYELHDFFLYHFVRSGASPEKLLCLAQHADFSSPYSESQRRETLQTFLKRFFANQFKRSCVPDGPKVGSVSLSPRGDWRMPSDASAEAWLKNCRESG